MKQLNLSIQYLNITNKTKISSDCYLQIKIKLGSQERLSQKVLFLTQMRDQNLSFYQQLTFDFNSEQIQENYIDFELLSYNIKDQFQNISQSISKQKFNMSEIINAKLNIFKQFSINQIQFTDNQENIGFLCITTKLVQFLDKPEQSLQRSSKEYLSKILQQSQIEIKSQQQKQEMNQNEEGLLSLSKNLLHDEEMKNAELETNIKKQKIQQMLDELKNQKQQHEHDKKQINNISQEQNLIEKQKQILENLQQIDEITKDDSQSIFMAKQKIQQKYDIKKQKYYNLKQAYKKLDKKFLSCQLQLENVLYENSNLLENIKEFKGQNLQLAFKQQRQEKEIERNLLLYQELINEKKDFELKLLKKENIIQQMEQERLKNSFVGSAFQQQFESENLQLENQKINQQLTDAIRTIELFTNQQQEFEIKINQLQQKLNLPCNEAQNISENTSEQNLFKFYKKENNLLQKRIDQLQLQLEEERIENIKHLEQQNYQCNKEIQVETQVQNQKQQEDSQNKLNIEELKSIIKQKEQENIELSQKINSLELEVIILKENYKAEQFTSNALRVKLINDSTILLNKNQNQSLDYVSNEKTNIGEFDEFFKNKAFYKQQVEQLQEQNKLLQQQLLFNCTQNSQYNFERNSTILAKYELENQQFRDQIRTLENQLEFVKQNENSLKQQGLLFEQQLQKPEQQVFSFIIYHYIFQFQNENISLIDQKQLLQIQYNQSQNKIEKYEQKIKELQKQLRVYSVKIAETLNIVSENNPQIMNKILVSLKKLENKNFPMQ